VVVLLGIFTGLLFFVIYISQAWSYASDDPKTCVNCHVMYPQYASWAHSSHARCTNCNDCHVPHDNFAAKYFFKAKDGLRHASIFTARAEPQVIQIKQAGIDVVQQNCIRCHVDLVCMTDLVEVTGENTKQGRGHRCWDCHREVPHGTVNSLASYPHALVPLLPSVIPDWLKSYTARDTNENKLKLK
jgi:cytochrome c nitrite reductase small subunit